MANWAHKKDVMIDRVYKELNVMDIYLIKFRIPVENSIFPETYEVEVAETKFLEELKELKEGKVERCYFTYGMTDIDFYKVEDNFALTHSPSVGYNVQLILANGELEKMINLLESVTQ